MALLSTAKKVATGLLDMDKPSRMARAKEQGYNVDDVTYRWLSKDYPNNKLPVNSRYKFGDAIYSSPSPSYGQSYANELSSNPVAYPMVSRGKIANKDDAVRAEKTLINEGRKPKDYTQSMNAINQQLKAEGFTGLDYAGERMMFDEDTSRSIFAAFDPDKSGSSNILASRPEAAIGGLLALTAMGASEDAEAGAGGTLLKNVMPAPQRMFDPSNKDYKPFLSDFEQQAGGRYLEMGPNGPVDITGTYPATANISVSPDGKPKFQVAGEERTGTPPNEGRKIKTNLFKKKAGWKWSEVPEGFDPNPAGNFPLVSVEDGKNHYYTVDAQFPDGAELARYPNSTSEPRLRPTRKGKVELGNKIGEIDVRGKKHPVYDKAVIREGATGAGILGALAASQSNDTYADYSPENLARLRTDDVGGYQAAQSPQLARAAGLMGQVNERGVDDPLMGMVSPRIPSELMNKIAYNDKRGVADYLKAAAGLLGLY